jgi:L-2-hydroxyglutarate oxidase LhgO
VTQPSDIAIIGGGIVGLARALSLSDHYPAARLLILDKEATIAAHQTGHDSGVIGQWAQSVDKTHSQSVESRRSSLGRAAAVPPRGW